MDLLVGLLAGWLIGLLSGIFISAVLIGGTKGEDEE